MNAPPTPKPIRLLLVDDHAIMRQGLRMLVETHGDIVVVGEAGSNRTALELASRTPCDVVVLDLALGDDDGLDIIPALTRDSRVLVLTGSHKAEDHRKAIQSGASGVVLKDQAAELLVKAISRVHAGEIWLDRAMTAEIFRDYRRARGGKNQDADARRIAQLTPREREVVRLVAQGYGTQKLASTLSISEKTVRNHLASIYDKLQVSQRLELALYAARHGLAAES